MSEPLKIAGNKPEPVYRMMEIFTSIKGEGINTGVPMTFCRFAGCNLACPYCDTPHARPAFVADETTLLMMLVTATGKRLNDVATYRPWLVFTGGEPLLQLTQSLAERCIDAGFRLAVETNGSLWSPVVGRCIDHIAVSPKDGIKCHPGWKDLSRPINEVRFLVRGANWSPPLEMDFPFVWHELTFSPIFSEGHGNLLGKMDNDALRRAIQLAFQHNGRVSVQLHKMLGVR